MKNTSILIAILLLSGCSGMQTTSSSGASAPTWGTSGYGSDYANIADPRLGASDVRMSSQNALEGPFSGITGQLRR